MHEALRVRSCCSCLHALEGDRRLHPVSASAGKADHLARRLRPLHPRVHPDELSLPRAERSVGVTAVRSRRNLERCAVRRRPCLHRNLLRRDAYRGFRARGFLHTARQRRIKAERTTAAYAREASTGRRCHPPPREARPCPRRGHRYQLSSTLMLSVIDDDARSYSELSARHAHLLSAGRHLGRAQAAAIIRDAWLRRSTAEPI